MSTTPPEGTAPSDESAPSDGTLFHERVRPSPATWLLVPGAALAGALVLWPVGATTALPGSVVSGAGAALAAAATLWGLLAATPTVAVTGSTFVAGRARVPLEVLGAVRAARADDARAERGTRLDARAYLCVRGWVDPVVRVALEDPEDPTPYWLVSTRRPEALVTALEAATARRGRADGANGPG